MGLTMDNGQHAAFERNNYFYGKLLSERDFKKEQEYFNSKRWLMNRLHFGTGVCCGFKVELDPDQEDCILITRGAALNDNGKEIVMADPRSLNPAQLTDDQGRPVGDPLTEGTVEICLAYAESQADPVPVYVTDCENSENCASNTIREECRFLIRAAEGEPAEPPTCQLGDDGEFPLPANGALHALLCDRISEPCPDQDPEANPCIILARVKLPLIQGSIDACTGRSLIYNNALLYELVICLAARVEQLAQQVNG